jgi:hypothetical protein
MLIYWVEAKTVNKNTKAVVVTSKETVLGVYAEKIKYMFMCHDQNAGQNHIKRGNKSFERVE